MSHEPCRVCQDLSNHCFDTINKVVFRRISSLPLQANCICPLIKSLVYIFHSFSMVEQDLIKENELVQAYVPLPALHFRSS